MFTLIIFFVIIVVPLITVNRDPGKVSIENRALASFPAAFDSNFRSGLQNWINDNIGFRDQLVSLNSFIKVRLLNTSTNSGVHFGKDDWYFYTPDHNLDLAWGAYPLEESAFPALAERQQRIADWYGLRNIQYYFVINPSKATVFPEFIDSRQTLTVGRSVIDEVSDYLKANTSVSVVNTKPVMLEAKDRGEDIFLKTDTHPTKLGAYYCYTAIAEDMGLISAPIIDMTAEQRKGEFAYYLGDVNSLPWETAPVPVLDLPDAALIDEQNAERHGDYYVQLKELQAQYNPVSSQFTVYESRPVNDAGTLLIYGDSWFEAGLLEPFSYNFSRVILLRMSSRLSASEAIEAFVKPTVVIRDCVERLINVMSQDAPRLSEESEFLSLPDYYAMQKNYDDAHLEGFALENNILDSRIISADWSEGVVHIMGWTFDTHSRESVSALYVRGKNNKLIEISNKNNPRQGFSGFWRDFAGDTFDVTENVNFAIDIPVSALENQDKLIFERVGAWGERLPSVTFTIEYTGGYKY
jgi:hypothetical protein